MIEDEDLDVEEVTDDDEPNIPYDITSYPSDLTLKVLHDFWKEQDFIIPEFQRKFVWTIKQSSILIESFLKGLPVPQIFLYVHDDNKSIIIDGLQRIMSIVYFFEGYFGEENLQGRRKVFKLSGLSEKSRFANKKFKDLDEVDQRKLRNSVLRAINIRQNHPEGDQTSMYHIFERLNTGGTPLKPQEIRNCVYMGEFYNILSELNTDGNWRKILGKQKIDKHQKDVELMLRLFALTDNSNNYEKPMKEFLNKAMSANRDGKNKRVNNFKKKFSKICKIITTDLGEKPFHLNGPLNSSVMDSVFCTILENSQKLKVNLKEQYKDLIKNEEFKKATYDSTSDVSILQKRFELARQYLVSSA